MVERIYVAAEHGAFPSERGRVVVVAGKGIEGDRNFGESTWSGQNLTLVEAEAIEVISSESGAQIDPAATRRNLVVRGVRLNGLVGVEFRIGEVVLRGVETCEPCATLAAHLGWEPKAALTAFRGRGGLRCDVLAGGIIEAGMPLLVP